MLGDFSQHLILSSGASTLTKSLQILVRWFAAWQLFVYLYCEFPAQQLRYQRVAQGGEVGQIEGGARLAAAGGEPDEAVVAVLVDGANADC